MSVAGCCDCGCRGARGGGGGGTSRPGPVFVSWLSGGAYGTGRPGAIGGRLIGESLPWCGHLVVMACSVWYWWRLVSVEGAAGGLGMPDRHGVGRVLGSAGGGVALPGSSGRMRRRGVVPITCMERYAWAARDMCAGCLGGGGNPTLCHGRWLMMCAI